MRRRLRVVFVGINAGERSARIGHYYAGRGNQFWPLLFESGLIPQRLNPEDDRRVLEFGIGMTDVVKRWTKSANELRAADFKLGIPRLRKVLKSCTPPIVAFNGKAGYERLRGRAAKLGWQRELLEGARVFVLPSTSGRNGSLTRAEKLAYFRRLARGVKRNVR